jgi:RNA polymerase sigma-70 factor (TIGR02960 family)
VAADLIARARSGDEDAFRQLTEPYRRELEVHCYRILGSAADAEDAMQEVLLAAWRGLGQFEVRSSIRTWLYRIATRRCLNARRSADRRPAASSLANLPMPEPTGRGDVSWLEPYPDHLLAELADLGPGPDARYETREAISLAFVTALQVLPPRQRAALILRDVLGYHAFEAASILESSEEAVTSALKRARATMESRLADRERDGPPPAPNSPVERELIEELARAFEIGDVERIVSRLTEDVLFTMPPLPLEYRGRERAAQFLAVVAAPPGHPYRLVWTRANGQPAFATYMREEHANLYHAMGLLVLTLAGDRISAITRFEKGVLSRFGLSRTLAG